MLGREIKVSLVKKTKNAATADEPQVTTEDINDMLEDVITGTGRVIVHATAALMVVSAVCKIAVNRLSK